MIFIFSGTGKVIASTSIILQNNVFYFLFNYNYSSKS